MDLEGPPPTTPPPVPEERLAMVSAPSELDEVICDTPGIWAICRSKGWATEEAMVSGLAPGSCEDTWIVGKST